MKHLHLTREEYNRMRELLALERRDTLTHYELLELQYLIDKFNERYDEED